MTEREEISPIEILPNNRLSVFREIAKEYGTPSYVYFQNDLENNLKTFMEIPAPNGLVVRYAMKANPTRAILQLFNERGAHIDASTFNEVLRAMAAGIDGSKIRLTSQEIQPVEMLDYINNNGILYTACSPRQLATYGERLPGTEVGIRFNVGIGSGWNAHTTTGGKNSSFGIFGHREEINELLRKYSLNLTTVHLHIGSGSDPNKQKEAIRAGLEIVRDYPSVSVLDMGGGFKVARTRDEHGTDIKEMGQTMADALIGFEKETGRKIRLEVEPGTALVANAGYIMNKIIDIRDTETDGKEFLVVDSGMNMNARPALYAAQHPIYILPQSEGIRGIKEYAVVGVNCESGDLLTPQSGQAERIATRPLLEARVGDLLIVGGAGAYTSGMAIEHYNSQQAGREIMIGKDLSFYEVRIQEPIGDLWRYEIGLPQIRI